MFGITFDEPAYVYGDNQSVIANTTIPQYTLKIKSQSIDFHLVHEGYTAHEWRTTYINTLLNVANLMRKPLAGKKQ